MEKSDKPTYESASVIGALYRTVKDFAPQYSSSTPFKFDMAKESYDEGMLFTGFREYVEDAQRYKRRYDEKLASLMDYYGIKMEAEILGARFMKISKSSTKSQDTETIEIAMRSLRNEGIAWFNERGPDLNSDADEVYSKASAWYYVTYHLSYFNENNEALNAEHLISFPRCVSDKLVDIKKKGLNNCHYLRVYCNSSNTYGSMRGGMKLEYGSMRGDLIQNLELMRCMQKLPLGTMSLAIRVILVDTMWD